MSSKVKSKSSTSFSKERKLSGNERSSEKKAGSRGGIGSGSKSVVARLGCGGIGSPAGWSAIARNNRRVMYRMCWNCKETETRHSGAQLPSHCRELAEISNTSKPLKEQNDRSYVEPNDRTPNAYTPWVPDPVTGYYRPENQAKELDPPGIFRLDPKELSDSLP
ncbi:hypothetical protein RJ640_002800 [Escallonia rubra]|uniref:Uncharacterized protein n=1 Tax=Escallonia rubra TaxID=112253 RepID=A0AA88R7L0_9ASTE|nr:hypothetical protein RJ640_002800 [Escallonia rubra]